MKIVYVEWKDAWQHAGEALPLSGFGKEKPLDQYSVGFLVGESAAGLTLAQSISHDFSANEEPKAAETLFVPRGMLKRMVCIEEVTAL